MDNSQSNELSADGPAENVIRDRVLRLSREHATGLPAHRRSGC
ncbi:hypothetical protein I553_0475 [Mycobacterium xenopi 4042]|uniref:Uncharacterized protein n=1 Tax=Mycobacterium xenopi 4042 TaxID=1299334 RepID=X7YI67_MYCXE|nr:hypothetical protein I553_0475 [Mycobacterium xenopi 4042]